MTHSEFNRLYDNGEISVKIWAGVVDGDKKSIEAFEYGGKFFLRIHSDHEYITGRRDNGKRYHMVRGYHVIKEFDTKEQANAYFKKCSTGLRRVYSW